MTLPPFPRSLGVAQAPYRLPQVLAAGLQQRYRAHQPLQEISREPQARPSAAYGLHRGCGAVGGDGSGGSRGMGGLPADRCRTMAHGVGTGSAGALFAHHLHRRHPLGAQSARGCAQHRLGLHPAHGLWLRLPLGVVEALCVWQE